jgi:hypothetical protein
VLHEAARGTGVVIDRSPASDDQIYFKLTADELGFVFATGKQNDCRLLLAAK